MVLLNAQGEVADFVNESQFEAGESAYTCVALHAALIHYAGEPGHGPTGTGEQVDQLGDLWYGKEEGSFAASNTNGMSIDAEYLALSGMGLRFYALPISAASAHASDIAYVKAWLSVGLPVLICGAEAGMFDMDLGDVVPYAWPPSGNHAIVACGIAGDGNLLVRDAASIDKKIGLRPGPRRYDVSKLQLVSGTAIQVPWLPTVPIAFDPTKEELVTTIDLTTPGVSGYFSAHGAGWLCSSNGVPIGGAMLTFYQSYGNAALCGLTFLGLPLSGEKPLGDYPAYSQMAGSGIVLQFFERGVLCYDPQHRYDSPPGAGSVYLAHLYSGAGVDPEVAILQAKLTALQAQPAPVLSAAQVAAFEAFVEAFGYKIT